MVKIKVLSGLNKTHINKMEILINGYLDFKSRQLETIRGGVIMYDVKGHYKYLGESELFEYYLNIKQF